MDFFHPTPPSPVAAAAAAKAVSQQKCVFGRLDGILLFSVRSCATVLCVTYIVVYDVMPKTRGRGIPTAATPVPTSCVHCSHVAYVYAFEYMCILCVRVCTRRESENQKRV